MYDTRLGRFISVDPIHVKYPGLSTYQFASNTPIRAIDQDELEAENVEAGIKAHIYGVDALKIKLIDDGFGKVQSPLYTLKALGSSQDFTKLRETLVIHLKRLANILIACRVKSRGKW